MKHQHTAPAINMLLNSITRLIEEDNIEDALDVMKDKLAPVSPFLERSISMNKANLRSLENQKISGTISDADASTKRARITAVLLQINARVPEEIHTQQLLKNLKSIYTSTEEEQLEKIIGPVNNMVKINWLAKGIEKAKSVCQVLRSDGGKGTGFVLEGGYLMTNFHVLPSAAKAEQTKLIFDYEEDLMGNLRETSEFFLDSSDCKFSPVGEMDYAYVKIKDPDQLLSKWGFLELDTFSEPQKDDPVTIIQHPLGQTKQIALTANRVINVSGRKIFYETDTERGSSGSPVFNNNWQVIALHHAGMTEEDGGLVIDEKTGERRGANEGILMRDIAKSIWPEKFNS